MAVSRRQLLAGSGAVIAASLAGCPAWEMTQSGPAGTVPDGTIPHRQDVSREDATVEVETAAGLEEQLERGRSADGRYIIWIPTGTHIRLDGRNLTVSGNVTVASGRGDGSQGALITTEDRGRGTPVMSNALITLEDGGRITGITIRGPHWNYTDSPVIPSYIPMAPGSSWGEREEWRNNWYARAISIQSDAAQVDNCEIWGFSTGIMVGTRGNPVSPLISYCHVHNTMMTSSGYCVDCKAGDPTIYRCKFDAYRHAINGYGPADVNYQVIECDFGPHKSGHDIDCHRVGNNESGSSNPSDLRYRWRAGNRLLVRGCRFFATRNVDQSHHNGAAAGPWEPSPYVNFAAGDLSPAVRIRGVPAGGFYMDSCQLAHKSITAAIEQTGVPGRFSTDANGWVRMFLSNNQWGLGSSN